MVRRKKTGDKETIWESVNRHEVKELLICPVSVQWLNHNPEIVVTYEEAQSR